MLDLASKVIFAALFMSISAQGAVPSVMYRSQLCQAVFSSGVQTSSRAMIRNMPLDNVLHSVKRSFGWLDRPESRDHIETLFLSDKSVGVVIDKHKGSIRWNDGWMTLLEKTPQGRFKLIDEPKAQSIALARLVSAYLDELHIDYTYADLQPSTPEQLLEEGHSGKTQQGKPTLIEIKGDIDGPWLARIANVYKTKYGTSIVIDTELGTVRDDAYTTLHMAAIPPAALFGSPRQLLEKLGHELLHGRTLHTMLFGTEAEIFNPLFVPPIELKALKGVVLERGETYSTRYRLDEVAAHYLSETVLPHDRQFKLFAKGFLRLKPKIVKEISRGRFEVGYQGLLEDSSLYLEDTKMRKSLAYLATAKIKVSDRDGRRIQINVPLNLSYFQVRNHKDPEVMKEYLLKVIEHAQHATQKFMERPEQAAEPEVLDWNRYLAI